MLSVDEMEDSSKTSQKAVENTLPWWHCEFFLKRLLDKNFVPDALCDRYERVNVWSHGIPGIFFVVLGHLKYKVSFIKIF